MAFNDGEWGSWAKTGVSLDRLLGEGKLDFSEGDIYFRGRHVIRHDSPVLDGVYLGSSAREAIVVNDSEMLDGLYQKAKAMASCGGKVKKNRIINAVFDIVKSAMPVSDDGFVESIVGKYNNRDDSEMQLDIFLNHKIGVCRHKALACAALLEKFKGEGLLRGSISVDRNHAKKGSHAWCRYTASNGDVIIIDASINFLGYLKDGIGRWPYARPEDKV